MKNISGLLIFVFILAAPALGPAQDQTAPQDGSNRVFHDELLDKMVGKWKLTGKIVGRAADHTVEAGWVLNHQFLKIEEIDLAAQPAGEVPYHAMVFAGYDNASERYVAHWLDVFGGRVSESLGYGVRTGSEIKFVFEYPDGPFHPYHIPLGFRRGDMALADGDQRQAGQMDRVWNHEPDSSSEKMSGE